MQDGDWVYVWPGVGTQTIPYTFNASQSYKDMQDTVIPNFHERMNNGEIFINPMKRQDVFYRNQLAEFFREAQIKEHPTFDFWQTGTVNPMQYRADENVAKDMDSYIWPELFTPYESSRDQAISAAWANVDESEIQGLASLGEMPETLRWIASLFQRALHLARLFKGKMVKAALRRKLRNTTKADVADAISDIWLEFRYAFRPLVFEMSQALTALEAALTRGSRRTARGFKEKRDSWSNVVEVDNPLNDIGYTATRKTDVHYTARAGVLYDISSDIADLNSIWGIDQPLESIYELTPWSFVLDWFFNVGDIISSWNVGAGLSTLGSWVTESIIKTETVKITGLHWRSEDIWTRFNTITETTPGVYNMRGYYQQRVPNPSRSLLPRFNLNLDLSKIIDLAALGRSVVRTMG
jgi:hypothetical protein